VSFTGVSPKTALTVGLKVDADALPSNLFEELQHGGVNLNDPAVTVQLLKLNAVVGLTGFFSGATLTSVGIQCALCHSTVDNSQPALCGSNNAAGDLLRISSFAVAFAGGWWVEDYSRECPAAPFAVGRSRSPETRARVSLSERRLIMNHKSTSAIAEPIAELQRQLDQFRSTRQRRTKLPESLWQAAAELALIFGVLQKGQ
jgi:hypothetical protein